MGPPHVHLGDEPGVRRVGGELAREAGEAAVAWATPLSDNAYKVQLAKVAVERSILLAAGLDHGGF